MHKLFLWVEPGGSMNHSLHLSSSSELNKKATSRCNAASKQQIADHSQQHLIQPHKARLTWQTSDWTMLNNLSTRREISRGNVWENFRQVETIGRQIWPNAQSTTSMLVASDFSVRQKKLLRYQNSAIFWRCSASENRKSFFRQQHVFKRWNSRQ